MKELHPPMRCFTCGNRISTKWDKYFKLIEEKYKNNLENNITISNYNIDKLENNKEIFEKIFINEYCCKRMLLTHPDK